MVLVLVKYKSLVSAMWLMLFFEYLGRFLLGRFKKTKTRKTPPGAKANWVFPWLSLVMFYLSLPSE